MSKLLTATDLTLRSQIFQTNLKIQAGQSGSNMLRPDDVCENLTTQPSMLLQ